MPDFSIERQYSGIVAGVDEAGRGPWAGPVVAAAAIIDPRHVSEALLAKLNDSKKLSAIKREAAFEDIESSPHVQVAVGIASVEDIDQLNILRATFLAMERAIDSLAQKPDVCLIDGNKCPHVSCKAVPVIKGDSLSYSIAAASIVAKVTRDRLMQKLAQDYPAYGWDRNAGYGTKDHQLALASHGVTPHHRQSYAPIRKLLDAA